MVINNVITDSLALLRGRAFSYVIGAHGQSQQGEMTLGKAAVFDDINNIDTTWCTGTTHSYSEYQFLSSSNILNRYKDLEP